MQARVCRIQTLRVIHSFPTHPPVREFRSLPDRLKTKFQRAQTVRQQAEDWRRDRRGNHPSITHQRLKPVAVGATGGQDMQEYAFEVKLVAVVRVRATEEVFARKVVPSVLGSPGTVEISLANETNTMLGLNATVTEVDFSAEGTSAVLLEINGKRVQRRRR